MVSHLGVATHPAVVLDKLTVHYRHHPALHQVSGRFAQGSLSAVVGPNGSGKSTLLKSIMGLLPAQDGETGGSVTVNTPRQHIAYLPQLCELDRSFPIDVYDCVLLGHWGETGAWGRVTPCMRSRAHAALQTVGLEGFERRGVGTLSAGQLQRVMFARMLVQDAQLILLDEPFNAIDAQTTSELLALVQQWHHQQRTVIAVLHDDALVRQHFPQTVLLARELVGWGPTAQVLTAPHLAHARAVAQAWDETAGICQPNAQVRRKVAA